jgi:transcription elongation GreA/GreB family factor
MKKKILIQKIIEALRKEIDSYTKAARAAHAEATHEECKAEDKYDTRGLEASYLARGQSRQVAETEKAVEDFQKMRVHDWRPGEPVEVGALVELQLGKEKVFYFMGPKAGGTEITVDKKEILVITPHAPLGQQLMGRKAGDKIKFQAAGSSSDCVILNVF